MGIHRIFGAAAAAATLLGAANAATVNIAGIDFDESVFGDVVTDVEGNLTPFNAATLTEALTGGDVETASLCDGDCAFSIEFTDNAIVNGAGADLAIFGLGDGKNEFFDLTINDVTISGLDLLDSGFVAAGFALLELYIDLSAFGVAVGETVTSLRITISSANAPEEFAAFAAMNSTVLESPIPAALPLFLAGLAGVGFASRMRKSR